MVSNQLILLLISYTLLPKLERSDCIWQVEPRSKQAESCKRTFSLGLGRLSFVLLTPPSSIWTQVRFRFGR